MSEFVGPEPGALVFCGVHGAPLSRSNFNKMSAWPSAVRSIGAEGLHFHDLRHTGNTFASSGGAGIKDLMARMGHDSERAALRQSTKRAAQTRSSPTASTLTSKPSRAGRTMTTARPVRWSQRANGPLMARKINNYIVKIKNQARILSLNWAASKERATGIEPA